MKKIKAVILGCGNRGQAYGDYSLCSPEELEIKAIVDIEPTALNYAKQKYGIKDEMCFCSLQDFLNANISCDIVINATMDEAHYETALSLLKAKYNILLEKPVTANPVELSHLARVAKENNCKVIVCHVLRYTPYFKEIKSLIDSKELGEIINIEANEHVWVSHFIESYVRGPWRSKKECGSSFLLAKSCHDIDIICWLNNITKVEKVVSFGARKLFCEDNKPKGATEYCYNCPDEKTCLYSAIKLHLEFAPMAFQTYAQLIKEKNKPLNKLTTKEKYEYLKTSKYGKCAFENNDIIDRQSIMINFKNGSTATFNLIGGTCRADRYIHIVLTKGEIEGKISDNKFIIRTIDRGNDNYKCVERIIDVKDKIIENKNYSGHAGGDYAIMRDLVRYLNNEKTSKAMTTLEESVQGHFCVYEADESMSNNKIIDHEEFVNAYLKRI